MFKNSKSSWDPITKKFQRRFVNKNMENFDVLVKTKTLRYFIKQQKKTFEIKFYKI